MTQEQIRDEAEARYMPKLELGDYPMDDVTHWRLIEPPK